MVSGDVPASSDLALACPTRLPEMDGGVALEQSAGVPQPL